jgi:hypothetical protein
LRESAEGGDSSDEPPDPRRRVRQLLLSGDNTLKNRSGHDAIRRARERFETARAVAVEAGLEPSLIAFIDLRLEGLAPVPGSGS